MRRAATQLTQPLTSLLEDQERNDYSRSEVKASREEGAN